ncbi:MAG: IS1 family transposase [Alphaproteobacteria bacterium]|nr:IS1 family transposase [Alphaproteobacteria bacterium]
MRCRHCGSEELVKDGIVGGKQRYKCKSCNRTMRLNDKRIKYSMELRLKVLKGYLEGVGIMSLERMYDVPNTLIIYWIRHYARMITEILNMAKVPDKVTDVEILEMDELYSYVKKNETKSMCGLLLTETETKFLILK